MTGKQQFVIDEHGRKIKVIIDVSEYEEILAKLEELESIRAYDEAKNSGEEAVPFERSIREIEEPRK